MDFPMSENDDVGPRRLQGPGNQECKPDLRNDAEYCSRNGSPSDRFNRRHLELRVTRMDESGQ